MGNRHNRGPIKESTLLVRQGQQLWHLHQALKKYPEQKVINAMSDEFVRTGRCSTVAEAMSVAAGLVTAYRSTEAGERVPQTARNNLDASGKRRESASPLGLAV